jgi:hypothetical protein
MTSQSILLQLLALLASAPAAAGVILSEVQERSGQSAYPAGGGSAHSQTELSAEGDGLRQDFIKSDSAQMPAGSYMLFPNDQLIYLVNPANKTYTMLDLGTISGMSRPMSQQTGSAGGPGVDKLVIDKKVDESGPLMLGLPTQHVVYEVSYQRPSPMQIPGFVTTMEVHERYEIWATTGLEARFAEVPALRRPMAQTAGAAGSSSLLKPLSDALASHGFILKQIVTSESKTSGASGPVAMMMHGRSQKESHSSMVTAIRYETLPPERFALPQGYSEVAMLNANMGGAASAPPPPPMPDLNSIPK